MLCKQSHSEGKEGLPFLARGGQLVSLALLSPSPPSSLLPSLSVSPPLPKYPFLPPHIWSPASSTASGFTLPATFLITFLLSPSRPPLFSPTSAPRFRPLPPSPAPSDLSIPLQAPWPPDRKLLEALGAFLGNPIKGHSRSGNSQVSLPLPDCGNPSTTPDPNTIPTSVSLPDPVPQGRPAGQGLLYLGPCLPGIERKQKLCP